MFWGKRLRSSAQNSPIKDNDNLNMVEDSEPENDQELCLVCVDLARFNPIKIDKRQVIVPATATHGAGGEDYAWKACFEHYKVITSLSWLVLRGKMDVTFYNPHEEKRRQARDREAYQSYDENCGCQRCMNDSGRSIWNQIVCSQCQQAACMRTTDHRLSCGLPHPESDGSAP